MTPSESEVKAQIADLAAAMSAGTITLLDGCRRILSLRPALSKASMTDPDIQTFVAIESELDDVPMGSARSHWAPEALAQKDREAAEYLATSSTVILKACRSLATRWK